LFTRIFKYQTNFQIVFVFLVAVALWFPAFIKGHPMYEPFGLSFGYNMIYGYLNGSPLIYTITAFVLLLAEAVLLNEMLAEHKITPKNSYITAFFYILLMSSTPAMLTLHPFIIVNAFIILLLLMLFKIKTKEEGYNEIFLCGLLAGISSLFYFKSAGLIIIVWVFLLLFHSFSWREWFISILGIVLVFIYLFAYFLLTDQLSAVFKEYQNVFSVINFGRGPWTVSVYQYITSAIVVVLFLVSAVKMFLISREKIIYVRKAFYVIFWLFVLNAFSMLFLVNNFIYEFSYTLLPLSLLVSYYYLNLKKILFGEIILSLLIVSIILQKIFIG
jgi:hypothetical protein